MRTTLILPDGSAFDSTMVAGIRWTKARQGDYGSKAKVVIDTYRNDDLLGFGFGSRRPTIDQHHSCEMENDEEAKEACMALVAAWTGRVLAKPAEPV